MTPRDAGSHPSRSLRLDAALRAVVLAAVFGVLSSTPATAQTNDHIFGSWRWSEDIGAARAGGMAGAFVAVADDASATFLNPAGLVILPKTEIGAGLIVRTTGSATDGATLQSRTGVGSITGAGLLTKSFAIGGYLTEPHDARLALPAATATGDTGFLDTTITDGGVAAGWRALPRVYVGARLNITHLRLQGLDSHRSAAGAEDLRVGLAAGANRVTGDLGVLIDAGEGLRLGAAFRRGASWTVDRKAQNPALGVDLDGSPTELRSPSALSAGAAFRANPHVLVSAQVDYVFYGQIQKSLDIRQGVFERSDYQLGDAAELRLGVETSWRVGSVSLQVRAGVYNSAAGLLSYAGADTTEAEAFPRDGRHTSGTAGVSLVSSHIRLDVAATFADNRKVLAAGLSTRF